MSTELLRIYDPEDECGDDGYPFAWHRGTEIDGFLELAPSIKNLVREQAGHRCIRCGHPYPPGIAKEHPRGEWTPCDERCKHGGPVEILTTEGYLPHSMMQESAWGAAVYAAGGGRAQWRILTVHHLNGVKYDCRWWNLASLCQRCHLTIQGKVLMDREWPTAHSEWFKPYAAAWYAVKYLDQELTREETMERLDELLLLEKVQDSLFDVPSFDLPLGGDDDSTHAA